MSLEVTVGQKDKIFVQKRKTKKRKGFLSYIKENRVFFKTTEIYLTATIIRRRTMNRLWLIYSTIFNVYLHATSMYFI